MKDTDKLLLKKNLFILLKGIIGGLCVYMVGFGVMNILWKFDIKNPELRGFDYYLAAYWGDRICLPLLIGISIVYILINKPINKKQNMKSIIIGLLCALIAGFIQVSWLISDDTILNWTIPYKHYFNFAGWYHAIFFIIMFFLVGYIFTRIWFIRNNDVKIKTIIEESLYTFIIAAGSGFIFLNAIDNNVESKVIAIVFSFIMILIFMFIFSVTSRKKTLYNDLFFIISGEVMSAGLIVSFINGILSLNYLLLAITGSLFTIPFIKPDCEEPSNGIIRFLFMAFPMAFVNYAYLSIEWLNYNHIVILLAIIILLPIVMGMCLQQHGSVNLRSVSFTILAPAFFFLPKVINLVTYVNIELSEITRNLVVLATYFFSKAYISDIVFDLVQSNEKNINSTKKHDSNVKLAAYFNIIILVLGIFIYFAMTIILDNKYFLINNKLNIPMWTNVTTMLLLFYSITLLVLYFIKKIKKNTLKKMYTIFFGSISYCVMAFLIYSLRKPLYIDWRVFLLLFPILGSSLMVAEGFYSNLYGMRGVRGNVLDKVTTVVIFIGVVVNATISVMPSININNLNGSPILYFLVSVFGIAVSYAIIPYNIARNYYEKKNETQLIRSTPTADVAQDGFTSSLSILMAGLIPLYYSSIVVDVLSIIVGLIFILTAIVWPVSFCLKNNINHYNEKKKNYKDILKKEYARKYILDIQMETLHNHLRNQNIFSYLSGIVFILPYDIVMSIKYYYMHGNYKEHIKKGLVISLLNIDKSNLV